MALPRKRANWTATESSSPSSRRISARSAGVASWPTMLFTGSPTKLNSTKHRKATASMTAADCSRRETMKASIRLRAEVVRSCHAERGPPGPPHDHERTWRSALQRSLDGRVFEVGRVVGEDGDRHLVAHRPDDELVMERQVGHVGDGERPGVGDHLVALGGIDLLQHGIAQLVHLGI